MIQVGDTVVGRVISHHPFGLMVRLIPDDVEAVVDRIANGFPSPDKYPPIGEHIHCKVMHLPERSVRAIDVKYLESRDEEKFELSVRVSLESGVTFNGIDQVNAELCAGRRIIRIEHGNVFAAKMPPTIPEHVTLTIKGASFFVVLDN